MSLSYVQYVADGSTDEFDVTFPYASRTHVRVTINGAPPVLPIRWTGESRIKIADNIPAGALVVIRRETPITTRLVDFQNGSVLTEEELDQAINQVFYIQQELKDNYEDTLAGRLAAIAAGGGIIVPEGEDILDHLARYLIESEAAQTLSQAVGDIALQGNQLATQALDLVTLDNNLQNTDANLASAQSALETTINAVDARVDTARTDIDDLTAIVDALAGGDPGTGIATLIQEETNDRIAGDQAIVDTIDLLGAKSGDNLSFILDTNTVKVSETESLGERFSTLVAADAANTAAILSEETARVSADSALSSELSLLDARVGDNETAILTEQTARANGDSANASLISALTTRVDANEDGIADNAAAILAESSARATAISAEATARTALAARVTTAEGSIVDNAAAIATEQTARADGDSALASSLSVLTSTVNGNTATISTLQSSVDGLSAKYGVSLDVNGYVTGFVQNNDGQQGSFTIVADQFSIVDPGNGQPFIPFEVVNGQTFIKNAAIAELSVGKLTTGVLTAGITQNADWNVGTGRIIWDNGTYMKVSGVGFGNASQFIEWFGPKMAITSCSEANAIQYLKTNGDAYFGGSLSAGILKNAVTTTNTASNASVILGPFGTNGNPIQVVTSYGVQSSYTTNYSADATGESQWDSAVSAWGATPFGPIGELEVNETKAVSCSVTVRLDRTIGASTTTGFATLNITSGTDRIRGRRPNRFELLTGYLTYTRTVSGSITSTDNAGGTTDRSFTATITTRTSATSGTIQFQQVSIVTTEE